MARSTSIRLRILAAALALAAPPAALAETSHNAFSTQERTGALVHDGSGIVFPADVAGFRRTDDAVFDTEAELYSGNDAVRLGLVDDVMSETEAWELLQLELGRAA